MANDYNTVLAKYNRLVSRFNDLQTQMEEKQSAWKEQEAGYKRIESAARDLCLQILAKDKDEMVLGSEYSWSQLDTWTLIGKAKSSFARYSMERTELLKKIQETAEERLLQIESLSMQLSQYLHENRTLEKASEDAVKYDEETGQVIEDEEVQAPENAESVTKPVQNEDVTKAIKKAPYKMQQAAESGKIDIYIAEEDDDVSLADIQQQVEMAQVNHCVSVEKSGVKVIPSVKKKIAMEQERKKQAEVMMIDIEPIKERLDDRAMLIIEIFGKYGYCEMSDIRAEFDRLFMERGMGKAPLVDGSFRRLLYSITTLGIITADKDIEHPLKSKFFVYYLSDIGKRIYESQFGEKPVESQRERLIAEHDNLSHAFGIKALKEILDSSNEYSSVSMSRAENTIKLQNGVLYIPDIIAVGKPPKGKSKGFVTYMEYERNTHHQADYNDKLNKMLYVTRWLNIVAPNYNAAKNLVEKTNAWIESRGIQSLRSAKVRITTIKRLSDAVTNGSSINDDKNWYAVYILSNGPTPVIRDNTV